MALTREEQEIILKVTNLAELQRLNTELAQEKQSILDATRAVESGEMSRQAYESSVRRSVVEVQRHAEAIKIQDKLTRDYRQNMMALSYVANDFLSVQGNIQQRLNAIANNMPMLLAGFGALGPVLSGLLPAMGMLIANFDNIKKAMGFDVAVKTGVDALDTLKIALKELESKPVKLWIDLIQIKAAQAQIKKLQKDLASFREAEEMRSAREQKAASETKRILAEANAPETFKKLQKAAAADIEANDTSLKDLDAKKAEKQKEVEHAGKMAAATAGTDAQVGFLLEKDAAEKEHRDLENQRQQRLVEIHDTMAKGVVGEAFDEAKGGRPEALARRLRQSGKGQQADDLMETTPEAQKKQERAQRDATAAIKEGIRSTVSDRIVPAIRGPGERKAAKDKREAADEARRKANAANSANRPVVGKVKPIRGIPQLGPEGSGPGARGPGGKAGGDPRDRFTNLPQLGGGARGTARRTKGRPKGVTMGPTAAQTHDLAQGIRGQAQQNQQTQQDQDTIAAKGNPAMAAAIQYQRKLEARLAGLEAERAQMGEMFSDMGNGMNNGNNFNQGMQRNQQFNSFPFLPQ